MERIIQRKFHNPKLLEEALIAAGADIKPLMNNKKRQGNKRLALIGDTVLRLTLVDDGILLGKTTGKLHYFRSSD
jgi:ribonuclease-3